MMRRLLPITALLLLCCTPLPATATAIDDDDVAEATRLADINARIAYLSDLPKPPGTAATQAIVDRVLAGAEFGSTGHDIAWKWQWNANKKPEKKKEDNAQLKKFLAWLEKVSTGIGTTGHVLLWLTLLVLLVWLWRKHKILLAMLPARRAKKIHLAGIDITPLLAADALPDDVVAGAETLWRHGHGREAMSLLYRAALQHLGERHHFTIPPSGTEPECLRLVGRHTDAETTLAFRQLVNAWMQCAWQQRMPTDIAPLLAAYRHAVRTDPGAETASGSAPAMS